MRTSLARIAVSAVAVAGLVAGVAQPADAWTHGIGYQSYWAPGPPPGPELSLCHVFTRLSKHQSGDQALIQINNEAPHGKPGGCLQGGATIYSGTNNGWCESRSAWTIVAVNGELRTTVAEGPYGCAIVGAEYWINNYWGYSVSWQVTVV